MTEPGRQGSATPGSTNLKALSGAAETAAGGDADRHQIDGMRPELVAYPSDVQELRLVMDAAQRETISVAPWGGGTRTELGNRPERLDVVVDLSRLDRIVAHTPADLTVTVQAGITAEALQETLAQHGQFLALDPPVPHRATIGGTLATGVSGPLKWQYGGPRDVVIGMKVVQSDGRLTKSGGQVVKNVSGYDMSRLHIGGLGTLGIIAEVSLKLTPLPARETTIAAAYDTPRQCLGAALDIFQGGVLPLAMTAFDRRANDRMQAVDLGGDWLLAVRLGGRPLTVERQVRECRATCEAHQPAAIEVVDPEDARVLWRGLADFGWDEKTRPALGARASVKPSRVLDVVESIQAVADTEEMQAAVVSHPGHGTVLASWSAEGSPTPDEATWRTVEKATEAARQAGGSMVIERCAPEVKSRLDVWGDIGDSISIMRRLKEQYDPKGILNPGRFAGGI